MEWVERLNQSIKYIEEDVCLYGRRHLGGIYPKKENVPGSG